MGERLRGIVAATVISAGQVLAPGAVEIDDDGRIVAVGNAPSTRRGRWMEAQGKTLIPGLIDLQVNGAHGYDLTATPDAIWSVGAELRRYGVTAWLPTVITAPMAAIAAAQAVLAAGPPEGWHGARPLGLHLEGPFLNPAKKGAHPEMHLKRPDVETVRDWSPATGVRLVTLAPELPGALALIRALAGRGVVVSAGHSAATYPEAQAGFEAGVRYGTHLFNAMGALHQREPGLIGALVDDERVRVGLIADGLHVHPALVRWVWAALGARRLTLVSDAMAALGQPPGTYGLGAQTVNVDGQSARLADGTLAGSITGLDGMLRRFIAMTGASLADAVATVTATPAAVLGEGQTIGTIAPGARADLVVLDDNQRVVTTIIGGETDDPMWTGG